MSTREHLHSVLASLGPVVRGVRDDGLDAPTPCAEFDARSLVDHLLGTVEAMRRVGAGEPPDPQDPWGSAGGHVIARWREDLSDSLEQYAAAWIREDAWEGDAMGGAMTKHLLGDMAFVEVLLHGWDLARSSGQSVEYDGAALEQAEEIMDRIGDQGRTQGAFGPAVHVGEGASTLAKVLAASGRDPEWTP